MRKKLNFTLALALVASCGGAWADDGVVTGRYWFDTGSSMPFTPGAFEIDTNGLPEGLHSLNVYVESKGVLSSVSSRWFVKAPYIVDGVDHTTILYVDGSPFGETKVRPSGGVLHLDLDASSLPIGVHSINAQVITPTGAPTAFQEGFFYRSPTGSELSTLRAYYKIDDMFGGDIDVSKSGMVSHLDVDCSMLSSGIHAVSVFLASPYGLATTPQTSWFIKIPAGGEGVKSYEYWLNDNYENAKKVTLEKVANPLSILSLIDVDEEPFCSSRYAFAIEEGKPVTYARNDFQVRFMDADHRMTSANGRFTDMRVRNIVEDVIEIDRENRNYIKSLPENTIQWYKFTGEVGDSISLKLDRGGMIELYSPSAETLLCVQGAGAVNYSSCTLVENGVYYVAVHDVPARNISNVGVDFAHVHKFDMLSNTPDVGSVGADLFIDVFGNGFESLESLSLVKDDYVIEAKEFAAKDNYNLTAVFDFKNSTAPHGDYSLVAVYANKECGAKETVVRDGALRMEEATAADIQVKVKPSGRPATPYEVTIEITNNSNAACWGVPFNLAFGELEKGFSVSFKDFWLDGGNDGNPFVEVDNLLTTGQKGYFCPAVLPYIGPKETVSITLGFRTNPMERLKLYAWAGQPWSEGFKEIVSDNFNVAELLTPQHSNLVDARTLCKAYAKLSGVTDLSKLSALNAKLADIMAKVTSEINIGMRLHNLERIYDGYGLDFGSGDALSALGDYVDRVKHLLPTVNTIVKRAQDAGVTISVSAVTQTIYVLGTIPSPFPVCNGIICYQSGDPNDMKGYEAASGSNYIGHKVKNVDYTIEFENDPEIANASAMTVAVENEIDGKVLDLASFCPKTLQIGDKTMELPSEHKFVKTLDMRPDVNAIAELDFNYDASAGVAKWVIRSLDPLTMDETEYMTDGILPVNDETGRGTGYLTYSIDLVDGLADGTEISNSAVIVFDNNPAIETPVWTNITDYSLPVSAIESVSTDDNLTYSFNVTGEDKGAGIWYYDLYVKEAGSDEWRAVKAQIENDEFTYTSETSLEGANFMVIATDRAGNRQDDEIANVLTGDADNNGVVDANDVVVIRNFYIGTIDTINKAASDVNRDGIIDAQDALATRIIYLDKAVLSKHKPARISKK